MSRGAIRPSSRIRTAWPIARPFSPMSFLCRARRGDLAGHGLIQHADEPVRAGFLDARAGVDVAVETEDGRAFSGLRRGAEHVVNLSAMFIDARDGIFTVE